MASGEGLSPSLMVRPAPAGSSTGLGPDNNPLAVQAPSLSASQLDSGQHLNLSVTITGGYKPYNITWLGLPGGGCATHNRTSFACAVGVPSGTPTTFEISVHVVDTHGTAATSNSTAVTVNPSPTVAVEISPVSGGIPPFTVTLTAVPTYGTPPFTFYWSLGGEVNATGATLQHTFTQLGDFVVTAWANDSLGTNVSGSAKIHSVSAPSVTVSLFPQATVNAGASVSFAVAPTGGLGPFTYAWSGLPSFCTPPALPNASVISCAGAKPGTYSITVVLTDSLLHTAEASVTLTVSFPVSVWEDVTIVATVLAVVLAIVVVVQLIRVRRHRQPPPALRPADVPPPD